jgi:hypothetical protein
MSEQKHWRTLIQNQKYLGSWDLEENGKYKNMTVTIEKIYVGEFTSQGGTEDKPFVKLKEFAKPMVMQIKNFTRLEKLFGTIDWTTYIGKQVVLTVEKEKFRGEMVDALRFSTRPAPAAKLPPIPADGLAAAIAQIEQGKTTFEKIKSIRSLTPDQEKALKDVKPKV